MTKKAWHKFVVFFLLSAILLSSTGWTVDMHFCQGHLVDISLFDKAQCCGQMKKSPCKDHSSCHASLDNKADDNKGQCCEERTIVIEKADLQALGMHSDAPQDVPSPYWISLTPHQLLYSNHEATIFPFTLYKPPSPDRDIRVLYQVYIL